MSKWFKQYCELNNSDRDIICDRIVGVVKIVPFWANVYTSVVYEYPLTMQELERLIFAFRSDKKKERKVNRLIEKLERLRSQS